LPSWQRSWETQTPELDTAKEKWEKERSPTNQWQPLEYTALVARFGAKLNKAPDGGDSVGGAESAAGRFTTSRPKSSLKNITAFKIEAIADDTRAGRADDGNLCSPTWRFTQRQWVANHSDAGGSEERQADFRAGRI